MARRPYDHLNQHDGSTIGLLFQSFTEAPGQALWE